jgi:urease accessory protein
MISFRYLAIIGLVLAAFSPSLAMAHHGIDGRTPTMFDEGLISGLAHPVLGLDHLVFILAAGLASGALGLGLRMPSLFVLSSLGGLAVHLTRLDLPLIEAAVGASILLLGLFVGSRSGFGTKLWMTLFIGAGLFHGYAYGESIVGAAPMPLTGYLLGIAAVQGGLIGITHLAGRKLAESAGHAGPEMRHLGALLAVVGVVFFITALRQGA